MAIAAYIGRDRFLELCGGERLIRRAEDQRRRASWPAQAAIWGILGLPFVALIAGLAITGVVTTNYC